jgi:CheY-like chemotaxis protein
MKPKRVWMLVEDDDSIREMLILMMRVWGVEPLPFRHGLETMRWLDRVARGYFTDEMPEICLLDLNLPDVRGQDVGRRMRLLRATAQIPIVIMTAANLLRHEQREIQQMVRPERILTKPFPSLNEFHALLQSIIQARRPRQNVFVR